MTQSPKDMATELPLRLILIEPPPLVRYGVQRGKGSAYQVEFAQQPVKGDLTFDFTVKVAEGKDGQPNFLGDFVQGPAGRRFVYIDVGQYAGQHDVGWGRRMIVRLDSISWTLIRKAQAAGKRLEGSIPGTARDGGPNCATVTLIGGWKVVSD
jgi:hypothetical protein